MPAHHSETLRELDRLDPRSADAVRALEVAATTADGVGPLNEEARLGLTHAVATARHLILGAEDVVGYAVLDRGTAQLVVHPGHRRLGHGRRLAERVLELDPHTRAWAFGDRPAARALADRLSMRPVRELLELALDADAYAGLLAAPPAPVADGIELRPFRPGTDDETGWVALNAIAFADHPEQGRLRLDDLHARQAEDWFDPAGFWLAVDAGGRLLGYHWTKLAGPDAGEVYVLGVHPDAAGRGLGRSLLDRGLRSLAERGARTVELYVEGDNTAARRLYEKSGFTVAGRDVMYAR